MKPQDFFEEKIPSFGVAGNFTGHLEQAGEAVDFKNIKASLGAPKAVFPTYIPGDQNLVPHYLKVFPFDDEKIVFPKGEEKLQIEPECALLCSVEWNGEKIVSVKPEFFTASNDCSIRKAGAKKISEKKNWGKSSKGVSKTFLSLDSFEEGCILDSYRIASFLVRDRKAYPYGEDSALRDYSYIYGKLIDWLLEKLNGQIDEGPCENLHSYLACENKCSSILVSIGATRYTEFGETVFLKPGDQCVVVLYPENKYDFASVKDRIEKKEDELLFDCSVLRQSVVM